MHDSPPPPPMPIQHTYPPIAYRPATDGLAVASFVLGLLWLGWVGSILAVIFGHIALRNIDRTHAGGRGLAIAGLVLGYIGVAVISLLVLITILGAVGGGTGG